MATYFLKKMKFIDIGANLTHESFSSDLTAILEDARKEGVIHVILTGTDLQTNLNAIKLTKKYSSFLSSTVGFHPHNANNVDDATCLLYTSPSPRDRG